MISKQERFSYALATAAATGNRVIDTVDGWQRRVCDTCDGAGMHNGIMCATCNRRGWTQHKVSAPTAADQFQVR